MWVATFFQDMIIHLRAAYLMNHEDRLAFVLIISLVILFWQLYIFPLQFSWNNIDRRVRHTWREYEMTIEMEHEPVHEAWINLWITQILFVQFTVLFIMKIYLVDVLIN